jgi:predicted TIM-barrel fold metal-dependent hydrolase
MNIIDIHTHVFPEYADLAVQVMDRTGVECSAVMAWHNGFGDGLKEHIRAFSAYPGRFAVFGNIDFSKVNEPDFGEKAALQMERGVEAGMRGLKIYKALGLEYKDRNKKFIRVNDSRLDPVWAKAGELGIPIMLHTADPVAFWQPVNEDNFWNGVLYDEYAGWAYYGKDFPSRDELLCERNEVIKRHPDTVFICPHVGSKADSPQQACDDLDAMPNLFYDISARIPILGLPGRHAETACSMFIEFQERILFGTDLIYDNTNVPTGMQAQCLFQPYEVPLNGTQPEEKYIETSVSFLQSHIDFLSTDRVQEDPPFKRTTKGFSIQGLDLPQETLEKIMYRNAEKIIKV